MEKFDDNIKSLNIRGQAVGEILMKINDEKCKMRKLIKIFQNWIVDLDMLWVQNQNSIERN